MIDDTALVESEVTRRLADLAATTTTDPAAWDRITARTDAALPGGRRWPAAPRPGRWLLAVAAGALAIAGVSALTAREDPRDRLTTGGDVASGTTAPPVPGSDVPRPQAEAATGSGATVAVSGPACPPAGDVICLDTDSGDVDGDGTTDEVALYADHVDPPAGLVETFDVRVVYGTGADETHAVPAGVDAAVLLGVTDVDGDGREEIAYSYPEGDRVASVGFLGRGRTGALHLVGEDVAGPLLVDGRAGTASGFSCRDVDHDGRTDVLLEYAYFADDGEPRVNQSTLSWQDDLWVKGPEEVVAAAAGDKDADGVEDFLEDARRVDCGDLVAPDLG